MKTFPESAIFDAEEVDGCRRQPPSDQLEFNFELQLDPPIPE
jgi:hypothetical protein